MHGVGIKKDHIQTNKIDIFLCLVEKTIMPIVNYLHNSVNYVRRQRVAKVLKAWCAFNRDYNLISPNGLKLKLKREPVI